MKTHINAKRFIPLWIGLCSLLVIIPGSFFLTHYGPDIRINYTPSMPKGFYRITPVSSSYVPHKGDIILYPVPKQVEAIIYGRHYLKPGVPLMKPIAASAQDRVCIHNHILTINQKEMGKVFDTDSNGEPITHHEGCYTLNSNEILPISTYYARSFDGRYHGVIRTSDVIGTAQALWVFR